MNSIPCRRLPGTDDELPILGFGAMRHPERDGKIDRENAIRIIRHAIDQGIVYIDTSWTYHDGESEIVVGEALRDGYREKVRIATRMPQWLVTCREDMDRVLTLQMEKLGTRHIDFYLVHALTGGHWERLVRLGIGDFLETAKSDGRISYAGFSFHDTFHSFRKIIDGYSWVFVRFSILS
jgi:predicted aldo/keto reductase-like oxidoreductase